MTIDVRQGTYSRGIAEYERVSPQQWMNVAWANMYNQRIAANDDIDAANAYVYENLPNYYVTNIFSINGNNNPSIQELFPTPGVFNTNAVIKEGYKDDLDWYKAAIRHGYRQEYNLSASGSNERVITIFQLVTLMRMVMLTIPDSSALPPVPLSTPNQLTGSR